MHLFPYFRGEKDLFLLRKVESKVSMFLRFQWIQSNTQSKELEALRVWWRHCFNIPKVSLESGGFLEFQHCRVFL